MLVGGKPAAEDAMNRNNQEITHVINCCEPWCADGPNYENLKYCGFRAYDEPGYSLLLHHYSEAKPNLDEAREQGGRCLVHCAMGINRSACICAAYLIDATGMPLLAACELVKESRGCVLGNESFRSQLIDFAHQRGCLEDSTVRDRVIAEAPPRAPPPADHSIPAPPQQWLKADVQPICGARCVCRLYGKWHYAVITNVASGYAHCVYDHNGDDDCVEVGSPDLVCDPN